MWGSHLHSAAMICSCPNFAPWNKPAAFILHPVYVSSSTGDPAGTLDMFLYILLDTHQIFWLPKRITKSNLQTSKPASLEITVTAALYLSLTETELTWQVLFFFPHRCTEYYPMSVQHAGTGNTGMPQPWHRCGQRLMQHYIIIINKKKRITVI